MWKALSAVGTRVREIRVEGSGKGRDLVIVPASGDRLRVIASGEVAIETAGLVSVRAAAFDEHSMRVTFSGEGLVLEMAEVHWSGSEREWEEMWRRARTRSRPWWNSAEGDELELDWAMQARLRIVGPDDARSRPP